MSSWTIDLLWACNQAVKQEGFRDFSSSMMLSFSDSYPKPSDRIMIVKFSSIEEKQLHRIFMKIHHENNWIWLISWKQLNMIIIMKTVENICLIYTYILWGSARCFSVVQLWKQFKLAQYMNHNIFLTEKPLKYL